MSNQDESEPKKQLETGRGGSGRKGKTAVGAGGAGDGGHSNSTSPLSDWPHEPNLANNPRTVICERDELLRAGLKTMISSFVSIVGEATDGMAAAEMIRRLQPELVIMDVDLDALNGLEVCHRIPSLPAKPNVLIFTDSFHATKFHYQLIRAGARGFCLKSNGPRVLFEAIGRLARGLSYTDPAISQLVQQTPTSDMPNSGITDREVDVLIRLDLRNKEIAEELDMKLRTLEKHIECIFLKLAVATRTEAALKALRLGFVLLPKMPERDPVTGKTLEQTAAEQYANEAIRRQFGKD